MTEPEPTILQRVADGPRIRIGFSDGSKSTKMNGTRRSARDRPSAASTSSPGCGTPGRLMFQTTTCAAPCGASAMAPTWLVTASIFRSSGTSTRAVISDVGTVIACTRSARRSSKRSNGASRSRAAPEAVEQRRRRGSTTGTPDVATAGCISSVRLYGVMPAGKVAETVRAAALDIVVQIERRVDKDHRRGTTLDGVRDAVLGDRTDVTGSP